MSKKDKEYVKDDCHVCKDVAIIIEQDKLYCPTCYMQLKEYEHAKFMGRDYRERDKRMVSKY